MVYKHVSKNCCTLYLSKHTILPKAVLLVIYTSMSAGETVQVLHHTVLVVGLFLKCSEKATDDHRRSVGILFSASGVSQ